MTMHKLFFDEVILHEKLLTKPKELVPVFSLSCAQRLLPFLYCYLNLNIDTLDQKVFFEELVQVGWNAVIMEAVDLKTRKTLLERAEMHAPNEHDAIEAGCPYALDAAIVLMFAIESISRDPIPPALSTARKAYALVDGIVMNNLQPKAFAIDEHALLNSEFVQNELSRQNRDISELGIGDFASNRGNAVARIRQRAIQEGDENIEFLLKRNWS
jgi:hypothetical protein